MEKKALFIHGLHSDSDSTTGGIVADILKDFGYETLHPTFDLLNCKETSREVDMLVREENISLLAAHSLGGFYGFCLPWTCKKILINPCLKPEIEIPKLMFEGEVFPDNLLQEWPALRDYQINHILDLEEKMYMHGIFAKNDDLFSYAEYADKEVHFIQGHIHMIEGGHKPTKEALAPVIKKIIYAGIEVSPPMAIPGVNV